MGLKESYLTQNGWAYMPNGLIIQWGLLRDIPDNSDFEVPLPIAFPNGFFSVVGSLDWIPNGGEYLSLISFSAHTLNTIVVRSEYGTGVQINNARFIAIGC